MSSRLAYHEMSRVSRLKRWLGLGGWAQRWVSPSKPRGDRRVQPWVTLRWSSGPEIRTRPLYVKTSVAHYANFPRPVPAVKSRFALTPLHSWFKLAVWLPVSLVRRWLKKSAR